MASQSIKKPEVMKSAGVEEAKNRPLMPVKRKRAQTQWDDRPPRSALPILKNHDCEQAVRLDDPNGFIVGASVRGRSHRNDGTNRDDWVECGNVNGLRIIIVADGAGSCPLSRLGAQRACLSAKAFLIEHLQNLPPRDALSIDQLSELITLIQGTLADCMLHAQAEVCALSAELARLPDVAAQAAEHLEREIGLEDFSTTLLLLIHGEVRTQKSPDKARQIAVSLAIGDGMIAAITKNNQVVSLIQPDRGEVVNQTSFLTSKPNLDKSQLLERSMYSTGEIRLFLTMTDGVSEDYGYPVEQGMLELLGDITINSALPLNMRPEEIEAYAAAIDDLPTADRLEAIRANIQTCFGGRLDQLAALLRHPLLVIPCSVRKHFEMLLSPQWGEPVTSDEDWSILASAASKLPSREEAMRALEKIRDPGFAHLLANKLRPSLPAAAPDGGPNRIITIQAMAEVLELAPSVLALLLPLFADTVGIAPHLISPVEGQPAGGGQINRQRALVEFLNGYYRRGSFDDRSLVCSFVY